MMCFSDVFPFSLHRLQEFYTGYFNPFKEAVVQRCSLRKGVLGNFTKFIGKHLCQCLFFNKVAGFGHRCFPVNFVKYLRTPFLQNTSGRLLLPLLSSVNVFAYTEKGQRFREMFKTIQFSFYTCTEFPYHFVTSIHSFYKLSKMPFCKKNDVPLT